MMLFLFWLSLSSSEDQIHRTIYDVEMIGRDRQVSAKLALNKLNQEYFSIACRKMPGGTLFTCWVTPGETYVLIPRAKTAFAGNPERRFGLFPGGPQLDRKAWLDVLEHPEPISLGEWRLVHDGPWRGLQHPDYGLVVRWKVRSRSTKNRYETNVLLPRRRGNPPRDLGELSAFWQNQEIE